MIEGFAMSVAAQRRGVSDSIFAFCFSAFPPQKPLFREYMLLLLEMESAGQAPLTTPNLLRSEMGSSQHLPPQLSDAASRQVVKVRAQGSRNSCRICGGGREMNQIIC